MVRYIVTAVIAVSDNHSEFWGRTPEGARQGVSGVRDAQERPG